MPLPQTVAGDLAVPAQVFAGVAPAVLAWATQQLAAAGVTTPRVDAELLAGFVSGLTRSEVTTAALLGKDLWTEDRDRMAHRFTELITARARRVPLQHLTGTAPFRYLELQVGPGVFVPRPETELVAQAAIDYLNHMRSAARVPDSPAVVVDLCTGSGAIGLAVLTEVQGAHVYAVELDRDAHAWAAKNVAANPAPDGRTLTLVQGDGRTALGELNGTVNVVVSNPPYVPPGHIPVDQEVAEHDPEIALYGLGQDGLEVPRGICQAAARLLKAGGLFVMEHAEVQAVAARNMVDNTGLFEPATTQQDLTGRDRMVIARRNTVPLPNPATVPAPSPKEHP